MKNIIIILIVISIGSCSSKQLKISLDSDPCQDTQVFIDLADNMSGWFGRDSKASVVALTLATGAYQNCLNQRRIKKATK